MMANCYMLINSRFWYSMFLFIQLISFTALRCFFAIHALCNNIYVYAKAKVAPNIYAIYFRNLYLISNAYELIPSVYFCGIFVLV